MGIESGKEQLSIDRNNRKNNLHQLSGKTLGIDMNLILFKLITQDKSILQKLNMIPVQDIAQEIHLRLTSWYDVIKSNGIKIIVVFDGARNPKKGRFKCNKT